MRLLIQQAEEELSRPPTGHGPLTMLTLIYVLPLSTTFAARSYCSNALTRIWRDVCINNLYLVSCGCCTFTSPDDNCDKLSHRTDRTEGHIYIMIYRGTVAPTLRIHDAATETGTHGYWILTTTNETAVCYCVINLACFFVCFAWPFAGFPLFFYLLPLVFFWRLKCEKLTGAIMVELIDGQHAQ